MDYYSKYFVIGIGQEGIQSTSPAKRDADIAIRSRELSQLKCVRNDVEVMLRHFEDERCLGQTPLISPESEMVIRAVQSDVRKINSREAQEPRSYALVIYYAGHGDPTTGGLLLSDRVLPICEIYNHVAAEYRGRRIELDFILDSCFSGLGLVDALLADRFNARGNIRLHDLWAASLPTEVAYELEVLNHGVFTYTFVHKGNRHFTRAELAEAIDRDDRGVINKLLQGFEIPNPCTLLSNGRQHSISVYRGHTLEVLGGGTLELPEALEHNALVRNIRRAREVYDKQIEYEK